MRLFKVSQINMFPDESIMMFEGNASVPVLALPATVVIVAAQAMEPDNSTIPRQKLTRQTVALSDLIMIAPRSMHTPRHLLEKQPMGAAKLPWK